ncbi:MAG TPA: hypothetical protein VHE35_24510 [Kofleriaceae bacterium]|nr:hypothetical protein [Kofleriaceae bacterium]
MSAASVLGRIQRGLERVYRLATGVAVEEFVVDQRARDRLTSARPAREQLLVSEADDGVDLALYVDAAALDRLAARDPGHALDDHNLGAFLYALEGVSHFVYTVVCAQRERPVSALELELQAEVDKYVVCLLASDGAPAASPGWRRRLYDDCVFEEDLDADERDRYRAANQNARSYAASLERRFVQRRGVVDMLAELRRFYRLPLAGKLAHIDKAA